MKKYFLFILLMLILCGCDKATKGPPTVKIGIQFYTTAYQYEIEYEINFNTVPTAYGQTDNFDNDYVFENSVEVDITLIDLAYTYVKILVDDEIYYEHNFSYASSWHFNETFYAD